MAAELLSRWNAVFGGKADRAALVQTAQDARLRKLRARRAFHEALDEVSPNRVRRSPRPPANGLDGAIDEQDRLVREALLGRK